MSDDSRRVKIPNVTPKNDLSLLGNVHYLKPTHKQISANHKKIFKLNQVYASLMSPISTHIKYYPVPLPFWHQKLE